MAGRGSNSTFSVLGTDLVITGDIKAGADLHVDGEVKGDIVCASLVQGEASTITGAVEAESARLAGKVVGTITVRELVILKSARIEGDVHYDALTIEQGAQVEGRFAHSKPGAKPSGLSANAGDSGDSGDAPSLSIAT
jgi:cytoskeletal protein CcmA (bactofilin family)